MKRKSICTAAALILAAALFVGIRFYAKPKTAAAEKTVCVQVIHGDRSETEFTVTTTAEYLSEVLLENNIVENNQGAYGLYILTADGETAEESAQEWWCITKGGEGLMTGASQTTVADGDHFELTFTTGYGG